MSKLQTPINNHFLLVLSVLLSVGLVALITQAASTISTNITTAGNLTVSGDSTFGDAATDVNLFTGTLQATTTALFTAGLTTYGASVFNEDSAAVNFRVESDNQTHMAYVDGTNNKVGVASSTPWAEFSVEAAGLSAGNPIFVVGSKGTSTPSLIVEGNAGKIGIASSTPVQELSLTGDIEMGSGATTTLFMDSTAVGACLQLRGANGTLYAASIVATTSSNGVNGAWNIKSGTCQ